MAGRASKRIPKLEDAETFAGNGIPVKSDKDRKGTIPRQGGSWYWLLTLGVTPATVQSSCSDNGSKEDDISPTIDCHQKPEARTTKSENIPLDRNATIKKLQSDPVSTGGSRWSWLLAPDDKPATVATTGKEGRTAACSSPVVETSVIGDNTKRDPLMQGSWYWLLAPDVSPATVDTTTEGGSTEDGSSSNGKTSRERRGRNPLIQGSWCWLLAPDDTPATANYSTASRATTAAKRKRRAPPDGEQRASRPQRPSRPRGDFQDDELIEMDDDHIDCNTDDGDDNDSARQSYSKSKVGHAKWEEQFRLLVEYKNKHKTTKVPCKHPTLRRWAERQHQPLTPTPKNNTMTRQRCQIQKNIPINIPS